jgi:hypothetical protein
VALWWFNQMEMFQAFSQIVAEQNGSSGKRLGMMGNSSPSKQLSVLQGAVIHLGLGGLCRCANSIIGTPRHTTGNNGRALLVTHDVEWRSVFEPESNRTIITDRFFHPLAKELRSRGYEIYSVSTAMPPYLRSLTIASERRRAKFSRHYLVDGFNNGEGIISRFEASAHFDRMAKIIEKDSGLERMFGDFGEQGKDRLKGIIRFSFTRRYPDFAKRIDQAMLLLLKVKPSVVIIENEMGYFQRAVIAAARSLGTITIALQHGEINLTNPSYLYQKEDVCEKGISSTCVPMPDLTLVYGLHYKELLTRQSAFPTGSVAAVGNMQFDSIASIDKDRASTEFKEENSIAPEMLLALWTTQSHAWTQDELEATSKAMTSAVLALPQVQLVVKQHPMETSAHREQLQSELKPLASRLKFASKNHDIMNLISAADVIITKDSTTGLEAVAAGKPLIVLNLSGIEDQVDYVRQGAAVGVYRPDDLKSAINEALKGHGILDDHRQRYVRNYLMQLDGKAAKRVADLVESLSGGSTGGRSPGV